MSNKVNLKINNIDVSVDEGTTILDASNSIGIEIPTLCYLRDHNEIGACRMCVVEVKGARGYVASCVAKVAEGMEVTTHSDKLIKARKATLELILSTHDMSCLSCVRSGSCELQSLSQEYGCDANKYLGEREMFEVDDTGFIVRDNNKCVLCRRCVAMCKNVQGVGVIGANHRGFNASVGCAFENSLGGVECVACGQCVRVCPTGALTETSHIGKVLDAIASGKHVIAGTAPSVRVGIGEEFGFEIGTNQEGKMVSALKQCGFSKVFDVNMSADFTIMEEGTEFLNRLKNGGTLPMITSCSPGWISFIEFNYPELLGHLSTCKSPQQMFGALMKTYYAKKQGIDPKDIFVVSIMPCTAKKFEMGREGQSASGYPDIDAVLTTREMASLFRRKGVNFARMPEIAFDAPMGEASSAGLIFGATGGVMEAALRTVAEVVTGKEQSKLEYTAIRGEKGIKSATYDIGGTTVKVAVAHTLKNAKKLLEDIKQGKADYHFIEIMTCPGGCVNGGGQPHQPASVFNNVDVATLRANAIYKTDEKANLRKSHKNPIVKMVYDEFLGEPNSHKAHEILHTHYVDRKN